MEKRARRGKGLKAILVVPYKQIKLGLLFLLLNLIFAFLILWTFTYYMYDVYSVVVSYFQLAHTDQMVTLGKFAWPVSVMILLILIFVLLTLFLSIKYTHKIYGPLVSIHGFLDALLQNKQPERLQLRTHDQLKDLASKLNLLAEKLKKLQDNPKNRPSVL